MEKIGFIGAYDKENLIMCVAKILTELGKKVMVIDSTVTQKMKYIIPTIDPTTSYITQHEEIDFAIGIKSFTEINNYLGITNFESSDYDYLLMNIDDSTEIEEFKMDEAKILGMLKLNPIAIKNIDNPTEEFTKKRIRDIGWNKKSNRFKESVLC